MDDCLGDDHVVDGDVDDDEFGNDGDVGGDHADDNPVGDLCGALGDDHVGGAADDVYDVGVEHVCFL